MVIEMMYFWTEKTFYQFCPEAHEAGIVLLALVFFVFCSIFFRLAESCIMSILFTEYAVLRP